MRLSFSLKNICCEASLVAALLDHNLVQSGAPGVSRYYWCSSTCWISVANSFSSPISVSSLFQWFHLLPLLFLNLHLLFSNGFKSFFTSQFASSSSSHLNRTVAIARNRDPMCPVQTAAVLRQQCHYWSPKKICF